MEVEGIFAAVKVLPEDMLEELRRMIENELKERTARRGTFSFKVSFSNDPRKGVPYAARLVWNPQEGKVEREFYPLEKTWGKKEVTVFGEFTAKPGEIVEIREGGSWKNDYRCWYAVTPEGKLKPVADIQSSKEKAKVLRYLKGEIGFEELLGGKK